MKKSQVKFDTQHAINVILQRYIKLQTNRLIAYAQQELERMLATHTFKNRTKNLEDSYAFGVYYNGVLQRSGYRDKQADKAARYHGRDIWGHDEAFNFIEGGRYQPPSQGWCVVWVAAAPYSIFLDSQASTGSKSNHFFVISQRYDEIKRVFGAKAKVTFKP